MGDVKNSEDDALQDELFIPRYNWQYMRDTAQVVTPTDNFDSYSNSDTSPSQLAAFKNGVKCPYCDRIYTSVTAFEYHKRTHTGEKPFACTFCSYRSISKCNLEKHLKTHTGEKPFQCPYCSHRTAQKSNLNPHIRKHHPEALLI